MYLDVDFKNSKKIFEKIILQLPIHVSLSGPSLQKKNDYDIF